MVDCYNTSYSIKILIKDLKVKRHECLYRSHYLYKPRSRKPSVSTKLRTESTGIPGRPEVRTWCLKTPRSGCLPSEDTCLHCQVWIPSRARELRFHRPHGQKQRKKRQKA